jgi:cytochrome c5
MKSLAPALSLALFTSMGTAHAADGATVYNQNCAMCHAVGLAESPKFGDKAAWAPRLATGRDALINSALKGKGVMPPKAGNPKLSDEEVVAALDHMVAAVK